MKHNTKKGLESLISQYVAPIALNSGFIQVDWWRFVRIRHQMIDVLSVSRMRGTQLHKLGFFSNILANAHGGLLRKIISGYQVSSNLDTGFRWEATDSISHEAVFEDIVEFIGGHVLDAFAKTDVQGYLDHIRYVGSVYNQGECMCLAILGTELDRIPALCDSDLKTVTRMSEYDYSPAEAAEQRAIIERTRAAHAQGELDALVSLRARENLVESGLSTNAEVLAQAGLSVADFQM